jgi:hypothetical protein
VQDQKRDTEKSPETKIQRNEKKSKNHSLRRSSPAFTITQKLTPSLKIKEEGQDFSSPGPLLLQTHFSLFPTKKQKNHFVVQVLALFYYKHTQTHSLSLSNPLQPKLNPN